MTQAARFWNRHADDYAKKPIKDEASFHQTLDRTRSYLSSGDQVLEIGCGTGTAALLLAPSVAQITATDISSRMVEIGREKASAEAVENVLRSGNTLRRGSGPRTVRRHHGLQ